MRFTLTLLLLFASLSSSIVVRENLRILQLAAPGVQDQTPLYLPDARYTRLVTLGFNNLSSDLFWFITINYFGKQVRGERDYRWLSEMCDLVVNLDPGKNFTYEFCGNMLSWEAGEFQKSIDLFSKAITQFPETWRFYYLRGFSYWYFLHDKEHARIDLELASRLPQAPQFLSSLAARLMVDADNPALALSFLEDLRRNATDDNAKTILNERIKRATLSRDLRALNALLQRYLQEQGGVPSSLDDLVKKHYLKFIPEEPFGGKYVLDSSSGKVLNSSGEVGLEFFGKTKDTGIYNMEKQ